MSRLDALRARLSAGLAGRRAFIEWLLVGLGASLFVLWLALSAAAARPGAMVYDAFLSLKRGAPSADIVVVAIDNRSVEALGRWPWPRETHARLSEGLRRAGPTAVGYDVLFLEPSPDDADLARAMGQISRLYLPVLVETPGQDGAEWRAVAPAPPILDAASGLGHVALTPDADGVVRRAALYLSGGDRVWPHLMLGVLGAAGRTAIPPPQRRPLSPGLAAEQEPLFADSPVMISYRGGPGAVRTVSAVDVVRGEVPPGLLADRFVLVGATADGLGDRFAVPLAPEGELMPGVEIQAALLDTLLRGDITRPVEGWPLAVLSLIPLWLLMASFLLFRPFVNMLVGLGLLAAAFAVSALALVAGAWLSPVAAAGGLALAWPLWSWRRLEAAAAYMQSEVDAFEQEEPSLARRLAPGAPRDVIARQVDAMRSALGELRDLERFISDTLRELPDATLVVSREGQVVMANERARRLLGAEALAGQPLTAVIAALGGEVTPQGAIPDEIAASSGEVLKVDVAPLKRADGETAGSIVRLADITVLRAAERQREQTLQLLSHDMRSPQVSILNLLDAGGDRNDPAFERRVRDYAARTLALAEGHVHLARAESADLELSVVDLGQIMAEAADSLWPQASRKGVTITEPDREHEHLARGDPAMLLRVFVNLIDNAVKYGRKGGAVVCTITGEGPPGRPVWRCSVSDDGEGLSAEQAAALGRRFHRGGARESGVGLGLAFVRTVAARHGGRLEVKAGEGRGAAFSVVLPQAPGEPPV